MNYFVDLSKMSLEELFNLKIATDEGWFDVDYSNQEVLNEHITFRLEIVERLERAFNRAAS